KLLVWIIGGVLLFWHFYNSSQNTNPFFLIGGITLIVFFTLAVFATTESTPLYFESIITGFAHRDMMYHASLIESIVQNGIPSTGVHGTPFINYHWGSHYMIAGLQGLIGVRALPFLNIVYPAVFIPLFLKLLFKVFRSLALFRRVKVYNPLFFLAFLSVLYSIGFIRISTVGSVSFNLSFIFLFLLTLSIVDYKDDSSSGISRHLFYLYCTLLLVIISISKISTGFLSVIAAGYLLLRLEHRKTKYLWILGSGLFIAIIVYLYIFPFRRLADIQMNQSFFVFIYSSIFNWLTLFFSNTFGFISHFIGLLIVVTYLLKKYQIRNFKDLKALYLSKENIDLETIALISLIAIFVTPFLTSKADISFFILVPLTLSIIYAGIYLMAEFEKFNSKRIFLQIYLLAIVLMSVISRPDISESHFYTEEIKEQLNQLTDNQEILKEFITEINSLRDTYQDEKIAIYIPPSEDWYYHSQTHRPISSSFIVPAVAGISMISGIPEFILDSDRNTYGFSYYDEYTDLPFSTVEQAIRHGKKINYHKLFVYQVHQNSLRKEVYDL
ncbi:MAG: hypothetical protein RI573_18755, partial [Balneolaceae bacterium]|nr:hypothetical protein [Balneolaceae bacterium]